MDLGTELIRQAALLNDQREEKTDTPDFSAAIQALAEQQQAMQKALTQLVEVVANNTAVPVPTDNTSEVASQLSEISQNVAASNERLAGMIANINIDNTPDSSAMEALRATLSEQVEVNRELANTLNKGKKFHYHYDDFDRITETEVEVVE